MTKLSSDELVLSSPPITEGEVETLLLGIGNILMGDEGIGIHAVQCLYRDGLPPGVAALDGGVGSFYLLEAMQSAGRIVMVDAAADSSPPGTIRRITPKFSSDYPLTLTAHDIGLKDLLDSFYLLGKESPEVVLFAVTVDTTKLGSDGLSMELSSEIEAILPQLLEQVRAEL